MIEEDKKQIKMMEQVLSGEPKRVNLWMTRPFFEKVA
jgi:hypothetical protein